MVEDGYVIIPNALDPQLTKDLLKFAQEQTNFKKAGISSAQHLDITKRSDKTLWLNEDSDVQSSYLASMHELQNHLNKELYLGIKYYESHFSIYEVDDFYEKHLDAFKGSKNRVVTTVYYLNEDYSDADGGKLIIYNEDSTLLCEVSPKANTLVVFLSDTFPHEVKAAKKQRYSIAGWFYLPLTSKKL